MKGKWFSLSKYKIRMPRYIKQKSKIQIQIQRVNMNNEEIIKDSM